MSSTRQEVEPEQLEDVELGEGGEVLKEADELPDRSAELAGYDLAAEAKDDWDNGARPVLDEIQIDFEGVSQPGRDECIRLVLRIKRKGEAVVSQGSNANQAALLTLTIDYLMLADTEDNIQPADDDEKELLALIGKKIKGKLALRMWSVLSRLGKLQQWTVNGQVGVSIAGMLQGSGGLSITFDK